MFLRNFPELYDLLTNLPINDRGHHLPDRGPVRSADRTRRRQELVDQTGLRRKLTALTPDVVIVDLENPSRDIPEELTLAADPKAPRAFPWRTQG